MMPGGAGTAVGGAGVTVWPRQRRAGRGKTRTWNRNAKEINKQVLDIINDAKNTAKQIEADALKKSDIIIKRKEEQAKQKILSLEAESIKNIREVTSRIVIESSNRYIKEKLDSKENVNLIYKSSDKIKSTILK